MEETTYKSWIEGNKWDIVSIQNEIKKYCYNNNIEIIDLHTEKAGFLTTTCFFNLKGDKTKLFHLQNSLKSLV